MPTLSHGIGIPRSHYNTVPAWILGGATIDLDFANSRYFGGTPSTLLSITRASNATDLLPSSASGYAYNTYGNNVLAISPNIGLLIFEARTNLFLNSTAPVTQLAISLPATGSYTLWVNGSGTAAIAGVTATITGAGTASQGTPIVINCTVTGTVSVTIIGSLNAVQLEAGAFGSSFIVTAGATATRAADNIQLAGLAQTITNGSNPFSAVIQTSPTAVSGQVDLLFAGSGTQHYMLQLSGVTTFSARVSPANVTATLGSGGFTTTAVKSGFSYNPIGNAVSVVANNGTVVTGTLTYATGLTPFLGSTGSNAYYDAPIKRVTLWSPNISDVTLKSDTQ